MNANLEHYKTFYHVASLGSVTKAAKELCISQPAVSQMIKQLEEQLEVSLFVRRAKGVQLTAEGEVLYSYVKAGYEQMMLGESKLREMLNLDGGEIRIGASDMTLQYYLLPYLEKYHKLYPNIKVSITNEGIYQNKRLLKYDNIKSIQYNKMLSIFSFEIEPFKDGVFVSKRILLYFYSLEEVYHFIITHGLSYFLSYGYQYQALVSYIRQVINQYGEDLHPDYVELFNDLKTTCDCCGNNSVFKRLTNDICPVCFWESDKDIIYNPNIVSDVNRISLADAKANYNEFGACEAEFKDKVRKPFSYEKK